MDRKVRILYREILEKNIIYSTKQKYTLINAVPVYRKNDSIWSLSITLHPIGKTRRDAFRAVEKWRKIKL